MRVSWRVLIPFLAVAVFSQTLPDVSHLRAPQRTWAAGNIRLLTKPAGEMEVIVRLSDRPLAAYAGVNAKRLGFRVTPAQQRAYLQSIVQKQDLLAAQIQGLGGTVLARLTKAHNAIAVRIDASRIPSLARLTGVAAVRKVVHPAVSLPTTVPYIGAAALQSAGLDGTGVRIAVLDSGIDYTHASMGGPGTTAGYIAAHGTEPADPRNKTLDGLFPTDKVIGGFDFVGEEWPNGPKTSDPDPIDFQGHGTHVADIAAGIHPSAKGVAPGAKLYAVKVCSAIGTSCNGIAVLQGLDFALDPNGDGDISDAVDVINLSLGISYGQREDDWCLATSIVSRLGVVVVAAAGNEANRPYIISSPAVSPEAIAVANTELPTARTYPLTIVSPPSIDGTYSNTAILDYAPLTGTVTGPVAYVGRGCPEGSIGAASPADPYLSNPSGKIALIDRGDCNVSLKIDRAAAAGAIGVLIGLIAPGDAVPFSFGGGDHFAPSLVITQSTSDLIKGEIGAPVIASLSEFVSLSLAGSMVASSSRGPGYSYNSLKPDIAAPGGSVSAEVGTGHERTPFGGTSGAAPMVAGSAALLLQADPTLTPVEVKARLVNTANRTVYINNATQPGVLTPLTLASGEVRVNRAAAATTAVWDAGDPASVSLSFGTYRATGTSSFKKKILVRNYSASARTYNVSTSFRYPGDAATRAVTLDVPSSVAVPANGSATFVATLTLNAAQLAVWNLNGGSQGGNGPLLDAQEYDGYISVAAAGEEVRLPWHILPHKAAAVTPAALSVSLGGAASTTLTLSNATGAAAGRTDVFSLTGTSPKVPDELLPKQGDLYAMVDLKNVGVRLVNLGDLGLGIQFAMNTWAERSHPVYPGAFQVEIDTNNNGVTDFVLFNQENGDFGTTGQCMVVLLDVAAQTAITRFYADADLNSGNMIFTAAVSDLRLTAQSKFTYSVYAGDNYFSGLITDSIENIIYTSGTPRFVGTGLPPAGIPAGGEANLTISRIPAGDTGSPSQSGLLLMYRDARSAREADAIAVQP